MNPIDLFGNTPAPDGKEVIVQNGSYLYLRAFLSKTEADLQFEILKKSIEWKQEGMKMYGKEVLFPRLMAWYGEPHTRYRFSGRTFEPLPWTGELLDIKQGIEPICKTTFNSVLLNYYRNGQDSMGWHADDEKELGRNPIIASLNLGAARKFQLKHNETKEKIELILEHGSLLIMQGEMQHYWKHQVPKQKEVVGERINLTFRWIYS